MTRFNSIILSPKEVYKLEASLFQAKLSISELMDLAVLSAKRYLLSSFPYANKVLILAGPGNNGADGLLLAINLHNAGMDVNVAIINSSKYSDQNLKAQNQIKKIKQIERFELYDLSKDQILEYDLIVDAIFGIGGKALDDKDFQKFADNINQYAKKVFTIDIASGSDGASGETICGIKSDLCLTFFAKKSGQILSPAKHLYNKIIVDNLGISFDKIHSQQKSFFQNSYDSEVATILKPRSTDNKYIRGHVAIIACEKMGAAIMAALAAFNSGCGLVSIFIPSKEVLNGYEVAKQISITYPNIMVSTFDDSLQLAKKFVSSKVNALAIGPGLGQAFDLKNFLVNLNKDYNEIKGKETFKDLIKVYDAEALSSELMIDQELKGLLDNNTILTPHLGEFSRLFSKYPAKSDSTKLEKLIEMFEQLKLDCSLVLKGNDTLIYKNHEPVIISSDADSRLAQAGTGDILAGMIVSFLAQANMRAKANGLDDKANLKHKALSQAVYLHSQLPNYSSDLLQAITIKLREN